MNTRFVALDITLTPLAQDLPSLVETALRQWGEPLRWAITRVDSQQRMVHVEAIVTTN